MFMNLEQEALLFPDVIIAIAKNISLVMCMEAVYFAFHKGRHGYPADIDTAWGFVMLGDKKMPTKQ